MKKLYRVSIWAAGIILALLLIAIVLVKLFFPVEKARQLAIEKGSAALGRDIGIESVDVSFWGGLGVELQNVTIANASGFGEEPMARMAEIDVKLNLLPLLTGEVNIDRLIVSELRAEMVKRPSGENNFTFAAAERKVPPQMRGKIKPEAQAAAATVSFDRLELNNGSIRYQNDSSKVLIDMSNLSLATSLSIPSDSIYRSQGQALVETLLVVMDNDTLPRLTVATRHQAEFDLISKRLTLQQSEFTLNGLTFSTHGSAEFGGGAMKASFNVQSNQIKAEDLLNLVPPERLQAAGEFRASGEFALDADIVYDDSTSDTLQYAGSIELSDATLSRSDVPGELQIGNALIDFETNTLRLSLREATFDGKPLRGQVAVDDFEDPRLTGDVAGKFDLALVQPFLKESTARELSGQLDFHLQFAGKLADYEKLNLSGQATVSRGRFASPLLPEPVDSLELDLFFDNSTTRINRFMAHSANARIEGTGRIRNMIPYLLLDSAAAARVAPAIDIETTGQAALSLGNQYLASDSHPELTGDATWDMAVSGDVTDLSTLEPSGTIVIRGATYTDDLLPEPIERFDADLIVTRDTITINQLDVKFPSSDLSLTGKLVKPFPNLLPFEGIEYNPYRKPTLDFQLTSHRLNTDKLFPEAVPGAETAPPADTATVAEQQPLSPKPPPPVSPVILPDINGRGTIAVDTLVYSEINFTSIAANVRIQDRKIEVYDAAAVVYEGDITGTTTIDLTDPTIPAYTGRFQATQIQAREFVEQFTPLTDQFTGRMDFAGNYQATGTDKQQLKETLELNADLNLRDGQLEASDKTYEAMNNIARRVGGSLNRTQHFKDLTTDIKVENGKVRADRLKTSLGDVGDLLLDGHYGFDGSLDYQGNILLSRNWSDKVGESLKDILPKGGVLGNLADILSGGSTERLKLPVFITGTVDNPSFGVDLESLGQGAAGNLLQDLLKKD